MSLPTPNTRKEQYLNAIATGNASGLPTPITREEEYLDAIAKGGGSGDGDMKKSVYDSDLDVAGAGGIKAFVNSAVAGKVDKVEGKGLSTNDYTDEDKAIVDGVTDALAEKADTEDIPDLVSDNLAKGILGNETVLSTDNVPFISKTMGAGKYQRKKFVGCSFVWNQLVDSNTESVTIASGHKYALYQNGAWSIGASDGTAIAVTSGSDLFTDLTQLFGATAIPDYIYNLEQATAGAGIAKLKELGFFTENYYVYDAGSIQSVDIKEYSVTGKNLVEETINATIDSTGTVIADTQNWKLHIAKVIKGITYTIKSSELFVGGFFISKPSVGSVTYNGSRWADTPVTFIAPITGYVAFRSSSNYITPQIEVGSQSTSYEPYHKSTYPLTPTELRGVPKIDANNNIYCNGDEYASDGGHNVKYGIVDLGTLNWTLYRDTPKTFGVTGGFPSFKQSGGLLAEKYVTLSSGAYNAHNEEMSIWASSTSSTFYIVDSNYVDEAAFKTAMSGVYLVYEKATPTTETLTPFDYPQSVGSLEEIVDYKVEQEDRDVAIPTGHVTEYMGKGGEFTLPTLPETPSVLAYDGHNFFWKPETT